MFDIMSTRSKIFAGATALGLVATVISTVVDKKEIDTCIEAMEANDVVVDPTAEI